MTSDHLDKWLSTCLVQTDAHWSSTPGQPTFIRTVIRPLPDALFLSALPLHIEIRPVDQKTRFLSVFPQAFPPNRPNFIRTGRRHLAGYSGVLLQTNMFGPFLSGACSRRRRSATRNRMQFWEPYGGNDAVQRSGRLAEDCYALPARVIRMVGRRSWLFIATGCPR